MQTLDYWIAEGPIPVILKEMATVSDSIMDGIPKHLEETPVPAVIQDLLKNMKMGRTAIYSHWEVNHDVAPELFQFTPPPRAKLVDEISVPQPPQLHAP